MSDNPARPLVIGMVAGEASGDNLGAPLVREILKVCPGTRFIGIGGPAMIKEGFSSDVDIERLSVNGFRDPLFRLPELIRILRNVRDKLLESDADCFVGIDFNFFNMLLAGMLRRKGIKTIHYVSPTVWAWRRGRVKSIAKNVDLMMTLYPFETEIYEQNNVKVVFVGHPKAEEIKANDGIEGKASARQSLGLKASSTILAVLPGSRASEVTLSGKDFMDTAQLIEEQVDFFLFPAANEKRKIQLEEMSRNYSRALQAKFVILDGDARLAMTAADAVLVNSGTATLEAMLLRRPMVMSYRLGAVTYAIISRLVHTKWFALPNILAGKTLVPEFIQDAAVPSLMAKSLMEILQADDHELLFSAFDEIHRTLYRRDGPGREAARAILEVCGVKI